MACTQPSATSPEPSNCPLSVVVGSATRAPPGRSPAAESWLCSDDDVAGAVDDELVAVREVAAAAGLSAGPSSFPVSRKTRVTPTPDRSAATPTMIQGSRPFFFCGGSGGWPYPPGGKPPGPCGGGP